MSAKDVQGLRKGGKFAEAKELAYSLMERNPKDMRARSELEWTIYFELKPTLAKAKDAVKADKRPHPSDLRKIDEALSEFTRIPPERPGMACSVILGQLCALASDHTRFAAFVEWVGETGLREEDWQATDSAGGKWPPLAVQIARALAKWVKARSDASEERLEQSLRWLLAAVPVATGDDAIWLAWDRAIVLRRLGRHAEAAEALSDVIKAKRSEFWVWAEAGRLYREDDPDLALSCFCRALECPADAEFLIKARRELAELLSERGEHAQASLEISAVARVRTEKGWTIGAELQALMDEPWFDSEPREARDPKKYYAEHSVAALALCFDSVETKAATYLGLLTLPATGTTAPDRKPRPRTRFAVLEGEGRSLSILGPHLRKTPWAQGQPLSLLIGKQQGQSQGAIIQVMNRSEGEAWDCTLRGAGVITREASLERSVQVFAGRKIGLVNADRTTVFKHPLALGAPAQFQLTENPKNGRVEAFAINLSPSLDEDVEKDVKQVRGHLRRAQNGEFGFIDDVFVPPPLVKEVPPAVTEVLVLAVYSWNPKKDKHTWIAAAVTPME